MIIVPSRTTKKIIQNNRSKILGDLWSSFCLDLQSNLGVIKVSPRLMVNTKDVSNQGLSIAFRTFDKLVFTIAGTRIFKNTSFDLVSSFGAATTYSTDYSDVVTYNNALVTTTTAKVKSKVNNGSGTGAWTDRATLNTSDSLHKLCYFTKFNRVYYIDDYQSIKSLDSSWVEATSGDYFISIPYKLGDIYTLEADDSYIWIGTMNITSGGLTDSVSSASVLRWDGISSQIIDEFKIKAKSVLAMCKDDSGVVHVLDSNGALLAFTGSGFTEIGRLPLNRELLVNALGSNPVKYNGFVHPNGMYFTRNGTFVVLVNNLVGDSAGTIKENLPSGIWEFHKETGFVHRQSPSYTALGTTTVTDHGQNRVSQVGALCEPNLYSTSSSGKPTLICGAIYYTNASSTTTAILVDDPLDTTQKYGYFVTSWIPASQIKDSWERIILRYRKLLNSGDKIISKLRTSESASTEISLTWVNTTSFTTATDLTSSIGYEVEIIQGTGSGKCSHIVSAVNNAGTYTVVVDETYTGVTTGTAKARIQNWIKHMVVSDQATESKKQSTGKASERIQIKICMQFTGEDEFNELIVVNNPHEAI